MTLYDKQQQFMLQCFFRPRSTSRNRDLDIVYCFKIFFHVVNERKGSIKVNLPNYLCLSIISKFNLNELTETGDIHNH